MRSLSRRGLLAFGASAALAGAIASPAVAASGAGATATPGADAFWNTLPLVDTRGNGVSLSQTETPLTFINVWAHWCSACLAEIGSLEGLAGALTERRLTMLLLSHPANWDNDVAFAGRHRLPFRLVTLAPGVPSWARAAAFDERNSSYAVPRSLVYRRMDRAMVFTHVGSDQWDSPSRLGTIKGLMQA